MHSIRPIFAVLLTLISVCGCSKRAEPHAAATATQAAGQSAAPAQTSGIARACDLVTAQEMTAILGSDVVAQPNDGSNGKTECIYQSGKPIEGSSPYAELTVEWGSGEAAMTAMGMMGRFEPGIADPYQGIGDQAVMVGPTLMIRSDEDLITIVLSGVDDMPATAKKIFATARARI